MAYGHRMSTLTHDRSYDGLLDAAIVHVMKHPTASLARIAAAGGVGRTTLFKAFPSRDRLFAAMGLRAVDVVLARLAPVAESEAHDGGLADLIGALIPVGPQLDFIWRTPAFDEDPDMVAGFTRMGHALDAILGRAIASGTIREGVREHWLSQVVQSVCYVAWQEIDAGKLARDDAAELAVGTLLDGLGA